MQRWLVLFVGLLLNSGFANAVSAQECPVSLPESPSPAQVIDCVRKLQLEIEALKKELEAPRSVGVDEVEFVRPALYGPNWSTHGGEYSRNFEYGVDGSGMVHLRGLMAGCPNNQPIFTLPEGFRPAVRTVFGTIGGDGAYTARVDVVPNGDVYFTSSQKCTGGSAWLTLDGISFQAEK